MKNPKAHETAQYEVSKSEKGDLTIHLTGRMDASNAVSMIKALNEELKEKKPPSLTLDLEHLSYLDDFGALVIVDLKNSVMEAKGQFALSKVSQKVQETLDILQVDTLGQVQTIRKVSTPGVLERLGDATLKHLDDLRYLISFIGSVCLAMLHVLMHPKSLRVDDTFLCMQKTGVDALPIVGLISFLLGLIIAFMSAVQLEQFGANIYVASLVSLAMTRELGPIMTCIIVAGRSGSSFAAEIGTMKISEEIDALFTMGMEPTRFLVVPKILASVMVVPLLTLFSDLFGIMGGLLVGIFMLDVTVSSYIAQTIKTLTLSDVFIGFLKAGVFALLIAWIGCLRGFQVKGGAAAVGKATTSAVVSSIFLIILTDSLFSVVERYWS